MMAGGGQVGAGLALYLKTKNKKLKQLTRDSLPVGILGIGEPMMYAVTLPLGKPFLTACLGSGFGGMLAVLIPLRYCISRGFWVVRGFNYGTRNSSTLLNCNGRSLHRWICHHMVLRCR